MMVRSARRRRLTALGAAATLVVVGVAPTANAAQGAAVTNPAAAPVADPAPNAKAASGVDQPIGVEEVLKRSKDWLDRKVPYNQDGSASDLNGKLYRTDCSGFTSMSWHTNQSYTTHTIDAVSHRIGWDEIQPGDAFLSGGHVQLLVGFNDAGNPIIREHYSKPKPPHEVVKTVAELAGKGYHPIRYDKIQLVTPEVARDEISANLPEYAVKMQPPNGETFVNFDTIFYTDAKSWHTTIDMVNGTVPVEVWADPVRFDWDFGDGKGETSDDPGARYPDQTVTHRYGERETFRPSVRITWGNLRYRLPGEDEVRTLESRPTATAPAGEITAIEADGVLGDGPSPNDGN